MPGTRSELQSDRNKGAEGHGCCFVPFEVTVDQSSDKKAKIKRDLEASAPLQTIVCTAGRISVQVVPSRKRPAGSN